MTLTPADVLEKVRKNGLLPVARKAGQRVAWHALGDLLARAAYRLVLRRPVDDGALSNWRSELSREPEKLVALVNSLFESVEYQGLLKRYARPGELMLNHLHRERCRLVQRLPAAKNILDLGGAEPADPRGVMLSMGYPHEFDRLTIVDMPPGGSHEQRMARAHRDTQTPQGQVQYVYRSIGELAGAGLPSQSVDLVWMGQSFEHIHESEARALLPELMRVLKPGGWFCLDTPNGRVARLQSPNALLHPDHKIEYEVPQLRQMLERAGFEIVEAKGIGRASASCRTGVFDAFEIIQNVELNDAPEQSYIQYFGTRKPAA